MTDEITLPLLPSVAYIVTDPASTEHGLWCERHGPYDTNDMQAYARAAVLLDRQQRPAPSAPAGWKLVPVEPTDEQRRAARVTYTVSDLYRAMIAASPPAPSAGPVVSTCDDYPECERERDALRAERDALLRLLNDAAGVLESGALRCDNLHHPHNMRHDYGEPCPVEGAAQKLRRRIDAALAKEAK
jgi:hypothetical protein